MSDQYNTESAENGLGKESQKEENQENMHVAGSEVQPNSDSDGAQDSPPADVQDNSMEKKGINKRVFLLATVGIVAVLLIVILAVFLGRPKVASISATYSGDTIEGVLLDNNNKGISVTGVNQKGKDIQIKGWKIETPVTLTADKTATVKIVYRDVYANLKVACSTSEAISISAEYDGSLESGITVTQKDITVTAKLKNGEEMEVSDDCTFEPVSVELQTDGEYEIEVSYADPVSSNTLTNKMKLICSTISIEKLTASYTGEAKAGTVLDENNEDITVTALLKNGTKKEISGWKIETPVELKEDETAKVQISFGTYNCELEVICSDMSESKYKAQCQTVPYDSLLRSPGKYENTYIKVTGTVFQIVSEASSPIFYSTYFIRANGNLYKVDIDNYDSDVRILEDDRITVWGVYDGIYSYETVRGNANQIASLTAKYYS